MNSNDLVKKALMCLSECRSIRTESVVPLNSVVGVGLRNMVATESRNMAQTLAANMVSNHFIQNVERDTLPDGSTRLSASVITMTPEQLTFLNSALTTLLARCEGSTFH